MTEIRRWLPGVAGIAAGWLVFAVLMLRRPLGPPSIHMWAILGLTILAMFLTQSAVYLLLGGRIRWPAST
jgi:hypothetical protein